MRNTHLGSYDVGMYLKKLLFKMIWKNRLLWLNGPEFSSQEREKAHPLAQQNKWDNKD